MGEILFPGIDPVLIDFPGPIDIRWYGLMYLVGFVLGHYLLVRLCRSGFLPLAEEKVSDLILYLILGVMIGGRVGYILFYDPSLLWPLHRIIQVWRGGMAFHGALIGIFVATLLFARRNKLSFWKLTDALALVGPPGLFFGRIANFINGELYGRIAGKDLPWGMRFPTDPVAAQLLGLGGLEKREQELRILKALGDGEWLRIKSQVPLRHPSQLYEALGEGLLLFLILWGIYRNRQKAGKPLSTGTYGALFLLGYGIFRFFIEFFRQPDPQLGLVLWSFSRGQELCFAMILVGLVLLWLRRGKGDPQGSLLKP
ncbi:MAG TPA: prolipoprotein diacylglyceryl transferase [Planctomycetes bacterium]|nr:prolipoprotein diacylglyceryl transferase [Planctomycetota bacterium]